MPPTTFHCKTWTDTSVQPPKKREHCDECHTGLKAQNNGNSKPICPPRRTPTRATPPRVTPARATPSRATPAAASRRAGKKHKKVRIALTATGRLNIPLVRKLGAAFMRDNTGGSLKLGMIFRNGQQLNLGLGVEYFNINVSPPGQTPPVQSVKNLRIQLHAGVEATHSLKNFKKIKSALNFDRMTDLVFSIDHRPPLGTGFSVALRDMYGFSVAYKRMFRVGLGPYQETMLGGSGSQLEDSSYILGIKAYLTWYKDPLSTTRDIWAEQVSHLASAVSHIAHTTRLFDLFLNADQVDKFRREGKSLMLVGLVAPNAYNVQSNFSNFVRYLPKKVYKLIGSLGLIGLGAGLFGGGWAKKNFQLMLQGGNLFNGGATALPSALGAKSPYWADLVGTVLGAAEAGVGIALMKKAGNCSLSREDAHGEPGADPSENPNLDQSCNQTRAKAAALIGFGGGGVMFMIRGVFRLVLK